MAAETTRASRDDVVILRTKSHAGHGNVEAEDEREGQQRPTEHARDEDCSRSVSSPPSTIR
jgi:hypothetical protein